MSSDFLIHNSTSATFQQHREPFKEEKKQPIKNTQETHFVIYATIAVISIVALSAFAYMQSSWLQAQTGQIETYRSQLSQYSDELTAKGREIYKLQQESRQKDEKLNQQVTSCKLEKDGLLSQKSYECTVQLQKSSKECQENLRIQSEQASRLYNTSNGNLQNALKMQAQNITALENNIKALCEVLTNRLQKNWNQNEESVNTQGWNALAANCQIDNQ